MGFGYSSSNIDNLFGKKEKDLYPVGGENEIDVSRALQDIGLDSLVAIEMQV